MLKARRTDMIHFLMNIFKLHGILSSGTTKAQYKVALPLAVLFLAAGFVVPDYADPAAAATAAVALAPLVARALLWRKKEIEIPEVFVLKARKKTESLWHELKGTLYDAQAEGWDYAIDSDGNEWNCQTGEPTGKVIRLPNPAPDGVVREFVEKLKNEKKETK